MASKKLKEFRETVVLEVPPLKQERTNAIKEALATDKANFVEGQIPRMFIGSITPEIHAIHVGVTKNFNEYLKDKLRGGPNSGVASWTSPYEKPVLTNHDMFSEPLGRVKSSRFENVKGKDTVIVIPKITEPEAIQKVLDERYLTVSVGVETDSAICSVCGTDWVEDDYCGHRRGLYYMSAKEFESVSKDTKGAIQCKITLGEIYFKEISFVNEPADGDARVAPSEAIKVQVLRYEDSTGDYDLIEMDYATLTAMGEVAPVVGSDKETAAKMPEQESVSEDKLRVSESIDNAEELSIEEQEYEELDKLVSGFDEFFGSIESIEDFYLVALEVRDLVEARG